MADQRTLRAAFEELPALAAWVAGLPLAADPRRLNAVQLCLEEVVANLAMHARPAHSGAVTVTIRIEAEPLRVTVEDDALPFDSTALAAPAALTTLEAASIGGLGLTLVRGFSTSQDYAQVDGLNRLTLGFA